MNKTNKIFLDTRWIRGNNVDGIGRVCLEYAKRFLREKGEYYFLYHQKETKKILEKYLANRKHKLIYVPFDILTLKDFVRLPSFLRKNEANFFLSFNYLTSPFHEGYKTAVFIHDFIPFIFKGEFGSASLKWRIFYSNKWLTSKMLFRADHIFSVSRSTKEDAVKIFNISPEKITIVYNSSTLYKKSTRKKPAGFKSTDYILYVGRKDKYKSIETLIDVFSRMKTEYQLVVAGPEDERFTTNIIKFFSKRNNWKNILFLRYIKEEELAYLYDNAKVLVLPSLYEGFGLPVLEAMGFGTPVIASNIPSLVEIAADSVLFFEPKDQEGLEENIRKIMKDEELRKYLTDKGFKRAQMFSWDKSFQILRDKIKETIE